MIRYEFDEEQIAKDLKEKTEVITEVAEFYVVLAIYFFNDSPISFVNMKELKEFFTVTLDYNELKKQLMRNCYAENEILTFLYLLYSLKLLDFDFTDDKVVSYDVFTHNIVNADYFDMTFNYF